MGAVAFAGQAAPELLDGLREPVAAVVGDEFTPLLFAPLYSAEELAPHLDRLDAAQHDDGGWSFNWPAWSEAAEAEWRGSLTVDALVTLSTH
jgi:hypothetical protein